MLITGWSPSRYSPSVRAQVTLDLDNGDQMLVTGFEWHDWQIRWTRMGLLPELDSILELEVSYVDGPGSSLVAKGE